MGNCRGQTLRKTKNILERRTKIIIATTVTFVIGLPLLFYIELARGFGSSAGDYYKITDVYVSLISQKNNPDSSNYKLFTKINYVDTSRQVGIYLFFDTYFYSHKINSSSALMAAREPGREGCKEKIKSISCMVTDLKTGTETEITSQLYMPNDMRTFSNNPNNSFFKNSKICLNKECGREAMLFENLEDFKLKFNAYSSDLTHLGLGNDPMLFYLRNESFNNIDSSFKVTIKLFLSDGSTISGSTSASTK